MITDMRDSISSWPVRIVLIVLIISFVSFYGSQSGESIKSGSVAEVNGESIRENDFTFQYQNLIQSYQKQGRLPAEVPEGLYGMIQQQLLSSLIYQKLKSFEAKKAGLVASNDNVKDVIKKQFSDAEGKFDFKFYEMFLRNQLGRTPGQYEEMQRENIRADMFEKLILETGLASNLQLKETYKQTNEKVSLTFVKVNEKNTAGIRPKPKAATIEQLKKYYDENQEEFKTKEKRNLDVAFYSKTSFKGANFPKDAESKLKDIATKYQNFADATKEDPRLQQLNTGLVSYEDSIKSLSPADLTEALNSSQNCEAGKTTVIVSRDGEKVFLIRLIEIKPSILPELETVKAQVEKSYAQHEDQIAFKSWADSSWQDMTAGTMSLESFAKKAKSSIKTTEAFAFSGSNVVPELGENAEIMNSAFKATKEKPYFHPPILINNEYVFVKLKDKTEPDWKKFETDQITLADALHQQSAQARFTSWLVASEKTAKIKRKLGNSDEAPAQN